MKLTFKLLTIVSLLYFTGCKDIQNITFDKSSSTGEFTIDQGTDGIVNKIVAIDVDLRQIASDNGTDLDKIKSLKLKTAAVTSTNGINYDEFSSMKISIEADGQPKKLILTKDPVNGAGATSINIDVDPSLDLAPYFKSTNIKLHFEGATSSATPSDNITRVDLTYAIEAELL